MPLHITWIDKAEFKNHGFETSVPIFEIAKRQKINYHHLNKRFNIELPYKIYYFLGEKKPLYSIISSELKKMIFSKVMKSGKSHGFSRSEKFISCKNTYSDKNEILYIDLIST